MFYYFLFFFFFKQKTAYEMRISDWSSDVCSSDLPMRTASQSLRSMPPGRHLYFVIANEGGTMLDGVDLLRIAIEQQSSEAVTVRFSDRNGMATNSRIYPGAAEESFSLLFPL